MSTPDDQRLFAQAATEYRSQRDMRASTASSGSTEPVVNLDLMIEIALPTAPPKAIDRRHFIGDTVQCEAIAPDILADILRDAIKARRDDDIAEIVLSQETEFRAVLLAMLGDAE